MAFLRLEDRQSLQGEVISFIKSIYTTGKHWASLEVHRPTTELFFLLSISLVFAASNHILSLVFISQISTNQAVSPMRASTSCLRIRDSLFFIARASTTAQLCQSGRNQNFKHPLNFFVQSYHRGKPWHVYINNSNTSNRCVVWAWVISIVWYLKQPVCALLLLHNSIHNQRSTSCFSHCKNQCFPASALMGSSGEGSITKMISTTSRNSVPT